MLKVTISGSYRKFHDALDEAIKEFRDLGAQVLSPPSSRILTSTEGFVSLRGDPVEDIKYLNDLPLVFRTIENSHLAAIGKSDLLWLVLPGGYCGPATAFEMGWALAHKVPVYSLIQDIFYSKEPMVRAYANPAQGIANLVSSFLPAHVEDSVSQSMINYVNDNINNYLPAPGPSLAVGAIIVNKGELLLVKTHKWGGRYSIVGGKVKDGTLDYALEKEVKEQTGLDGEVGEHVCTFDELPGSGYYMNGQHRVFVDKVVEVPEKDIMLNWAAQDYLWLPPEKALQLEDLEPNARKSIEIYANNH